MKNCIRPRLKLCLVKWGVYSASKHHLTTHIRHTPFKFIKIKLTIWTIQNCKWDVEIVFWSAHKMHVITIP